MAFALDQVVPWGRPFREYERMFALSQADLGGRILGCADGPASFNAEAAARGIRVVSCDPLYRFSAAEIRARIDATYDEVLEQTRRNRSQFVWREFGSIDELGAARSRAMEAFLADYEHGKRERRYVAAELPRLPFRARKFDLALCSHYLFLYSDQVSLEAHQASVEELLRVADEVRIFPLLALDGAASPHVEPVAGRMKALGLKVTIEPVPYEFQRGGNQMLRVQGRASTGSRH